MKRHEFWFAKKAVALSPDAERVKTPAVKRRKLRLGAWKWGAVLLALVAIVVARRRMAGNEPHATVKTAQVSRADVQRSVSASGKLQVFTTVDVKSKAGGTVIQMAVEEGTRVKRGQLICLIDRKDTVAAYQQAMSDVATARAGLKQAQDSARLQSASLPPQIRQSVEAANTARARLRQARDTLVLQRQTSQGAVDEARSGVAAARSRLQSALEAARAQPQLSRAAIAQSRAGVASAEAALRSARESLRLLREATQPQQVTSARAQLTEVRSSLETSQKALQRQEALLEKGFVAQNTVDTARNTMAQAQSALDTAQARSDTLQAEHESQIRDAEARIESAQGTLEQARAALETSRTNRVQDSLKQREIETARATLRQAESTLRTALSNRRQIALRTTDVVSEASNVRSAQAALQGTRATAIQSDVRRGEIAASRARLERAEITARDAALNLEQTTVVAPRDGIVLKKYVDQGAIIQSGQSGFSGGTAIVQLGDVSRLYVDAQVDESDIGSIKEGQQVSITLDAFPDSPKSGRVRKVFPQAEIEQNVTYVRVQVEVDPRSVNNTLRPNLNATCDFILETRAQVLSVPAEAVKDEGTRSFVTLIKDPKQPLWESENQTKRAVQVGVRGDERVEIKSGVQLGQTVVTQTIAADAQPIGAPPGTPGS
ncbi:MAG TPA: efflux RND transporter periplasmic adaptor subunit [Abditibacteriaceae bacterium]|nr:efflux RND transporter periplasmic adaptor subunit [Abditibacteriaceae bacterium]